MTLSAQTARLQIGPPGTAPTRVWTFNGQLPGPEIRIAQGAELDANFVNALPEPSTIHWHGIRLPNAMDGVPGLTQAALAPGQTFQYRFRCPDAGTFWYHPHYNSSGQLGRGLVGGVDRRGIQAHRGRARHHLGALRLENRRGRPDRQRLPEPTRCRPCRPHRQCGDDQWECRDRLSTAIESTHSASPDCCEQRKNLRPAVSRRHALAHRHRRPSHAG